MSTFSDFLLCGENKANAPSLVFDSFESGVVCALGRCGCSSSLTAIRGPFFACENATMSRFNVHTCSSGIDPNRVVFGGGRHDL